MSHDIDSSVSEYNESIMDDITDDTNIEFETEILEIPGSTPITILGNRTDDNTVYFQCADGIVKMVAKVICEQGFNSYFTSQQGGGFSDSYVRTWARKIGKFINYSYHKINKSIISEDDVNQWVIDLIKIHYMNAFSDYVTYLSTIEDYAPNTVLAELGNIKQFLSWFVYFRESNDNTKCEITLMDLQPIELIIKNLSKNLKKDLKKRLSNAPDMDDLVMNRELPSGGLPELQDIIATDLEWCKGVDWTSLVIDKRTYDRFMQILYVSLYAHSPQGRVAGVQDIKWGQAKDLLTYGYTLSSKFKTSASFGYQPVTTSDISLNLIQLYITRLRPKITSTMNNWKDPLFLHYDGTPATRIGDKVIT